jgi:hypothetical protein
VLKKSEPSRPPQTIISLPVHTAVCQQRGDGVPASTGVEVQLLLDGV